MAWIEVLEYGVDYGAVELGTRVVAINLDFVARVMNEDGEAELVFNDGYILMTAEPWHEFMGRTAGCSRSPGVDLETSERRSQQARHNAQRGLDCSVGFGQTPRPIGAQNVRFLYGLYVLEIDNPW